MSMASRAAGEVIVAHRADDTIVVCTMTAMRWLHELSPSPLNLSCVPLMGGASGLGLGLALAHPDRRVFVLDGDGSLLMQLGSLATISGQAPRNLLHFVFDNGVWFEGGGDLPLPAAQGVDFAGMATAAGYRASHRITDVVALAATLPAVLSADGPVFLHLEIDAGASERTQWSTDNPQSEIPDKQLTQMGEEARTVMQALRE